MKIPIVNEQDEIIGYKDRKDRNPKDIFRATGLWMTNSDGDILLAQRSFSKKYNPGIWGPAVNGTVEEGETYESNITKEIEEELGLLDIKPVLGKKFRKNNEHRYFSQYFYLTLDMDIKDFKINKEEVAEIKWFSRQELEKELKENPKKFSSGVHDCMKDLYANQS